MTPEQKRELAERLVELKEANQAMYSSECERRGLNEPGDASSMNYKMKQKQILLEYLDKMYRLSRITYINQYRESNGQA
jgi:hypothetical protein